MSNDAAHDLITVIDVMREMHIEPEPKFSWAVGEEARKLWESLFGELPEKQLRTKTNGGGSHCFAVYPLAFKPHLQRIILSYRTFAAKQMSLFQ